MPAGAPAAGMNGGGGMGMDKMEMAGMMGMDDRFGRLEVGSPMSFIEIECDTKAILTSETVDDAIAFEILHLEKQPHD